MSLVLDPADITGGIRILSHRHSSTNDKLHASYQDQLLVLMCAQQFNKLQAGLVGNINTITSSKYVSFLYNKGLENIETVLSTKK